MSLSNINTTLNFLNFIFVVVLEKCCTKPLNQTVLLGHPLFNKKVVMNWMFLRAILRFCNTN